MRTVGKLFAVVLFCAIIWVLVSAAQTSSKPRRTTASGAQAASSTNVEARKQLAAYVAEFQIRPNDSELRNKIIELAKGMKPGPVVPATVQASFSAASTQLRVASTADEFRGVAKAFENVAVQAPWYADAYFNAAIAWSRAEDYESAKRNLVLYVSAVRGNNMDESARELQGDIEQHLRLQQFERQVADFKASPGNLERRKELVRQAVAFTPVLRVPEEAQRYLSRGKVAISGAKAPEDFKDAAQEFQRAIDAAPWFGPAYYNLAVAQNAAGDFASARQNLDLYLAWAQDPADIQSTKDLIYQIEYKSEKAERERVAREAETRRQAEEREAETRRQAELKHRLNEGLSGSWDGQQGCRGGRISVDGTRFSATLDCEKGDGSTGSGTVTLVGVKRDLQISGSASYPRGRLTLTNCSTPEITSQFDGYVSEDGKTITLRLSNPTFYSQSVGMGLFKRCVSGSVRIDHWSPINVVLSR